MHGYSPQLHEGVFASRQTQDHTKVAEVAGARVYIQHHVGADAGAKLPLDVMSNQ